MKKGAIILFLTILLACGQEDKIENPQGIWTESELRELNSIVSEFDQILITEYKTESIQKSYVEYSNAVLQNNFTPVLDGMGELASYVKNFGIFDKIWFKSTGSDIEDYTLKTDGSYLIYLNKIGEKSDFINDYADRIEAAGDIQPAVIAGFARNIGNLDLNDMNNRLIFAIHYLTIING